MFATNFLFDGKWASDFGLIICSFDNELESASGGEVEFKTVQTPGNDKFVFYGSQFNSAISWNFSICKNPCRNQCLCFDQYEESMIAKWLLKTDGYRYIQFNQEGYENVFYKVYFNISPHQINGRTVGFDLTATSNCAYGFSDVIRKKAHIKLNEPFKLNVHSDINAYIYPIVKIKGVGNFNLTNNYDKMQNVLLGKASEFKNVNSQIIMDSDNDTISGLSDPNDFNWYFIRLVDGINEIATNSANDVEIEIQYRELRYIKI